MKVAADSVERDKRVEREIGGKVEAELWVKEHCREDVEVWRVGTGVDVSWRRKYKASTFSFLACGKGFFNTVQGGQEV